ncbi:isochorismatase family protein [Nocardia sp. NPDC057353]|uniref:isochorismatase family protein n=1 Tax=Nocardia sp. NPDC057353 TaxID=3346104 RepID=UPI0036422298
MSDGEVRAHAWFIEEREYRRHEERRGRRFAYPVLDPARTALVVIDMVPFHVAGNPYCRGIVGRVAELAARLRGAGGTVAWVVPAARPPLPHAVEFFGAATAANYACSAGAGPVAERLWPGLGAEPGDLYAEKSAYSAFFPGRSDLPDLLAARGIDTVLIAGTVTNVCCESSARDASTIGYRVILLADATAARRDADHNATLHVVYRSFGDVRACAEIAALLDQAASAERSETTWAAR